MSNYNRTTDDGILESGFISKDKILEYVSESDIFEVVFGFKPKEFEYVTSPFRLDKNPGCWFETDIKTGKLRFTDFGDLRVINRVKMKNIDCFDAVMIYYSLPSFYKTLDFIKAKLIDGKDIKHNIPTIVSERGNEVDKKKVGIIISTRDFELVDRNFWQFRYGIQKEHLIEDKVFPTRVYKLLNTRSGDYLFRPPTICYAYTEFDSGNKKLYLPKELGAKRFITNCTEEDIGGMHTSIKAGRLLLITKSYKDYRVLRNLGLNVRWFQNEGMYPKGQVFHDLMANFDKVIVFFDNDSTGIKAAVDLVAVINSQYRNKASYIHLPTELLAQKMSDPSDLVHRRNLRELVSFLKQEKVL
jgi:hypothetical protein